jgi:hypothetical protein
MSSCVSSHLLSFLRRSRLAFWALWLVTTPVRAQQHTPNSILRGLVVEPNGPTGGAVVELFRDPELHLVAITPSTGAFEFVPVPAGDYRLRVRRIGLAMAERSIALNGPRDSVRVELRDNSQILDSLRRLDFERRLASARARPRHWDCSVSARDVAFEAQRAYTLLAPPFEEASSNDYGLPRSREAFRRDFRAIRDRAECRRLAAALDRQIGLPDDTLYVFRVGRIYFLPAFGDMVVSLDGKVLVVFVVPS